MNCVGQKKNKKVWGVITPYEDRGQVYKKEKETDPTDDPKLGTPKYDRDMILENEELGFYNEMTLNSIRVNSVGEGALWVCNSNGNLENGDLLCSSDVWGYSEKQDLDCFMNYTCAKVTTTVDFDDPNLEDKYQVRYLADEEGNICNKGQHKYIACFVGVCYKMT